MCKTHGGERMTLEENVKDLAMEIKKIWTEMQFQLDRIIVLEKDTSE